MKQLIQAQGESGKADMSGKWKAGGGRELSTFHLKPAPKRRSGFTLIELIGVMAIIGILAAVTLPPLISKIEDANSVGEDAKLEEIARALVAGIKATGTIPNPNRTPYNTGTSGGWGDIAQNYTTLTDDLVNPGTLHYVFPEETQSARRVYLNDQFMTYLVAATGGAVSGVFQTPATGWPPTAGGVILANIPTRMYIVSSSKKDLFLNCADNQAATPPQPTSGYGAGLIGDLQNWIKKADGPTDPAPGAIKVPDSIAQWGDVYAGGGSYHTRGEFLHVKVVDLRPFFCQVTLVEYPIPQNAITHIAVNTGPPAENPGSGFVLSSTYLGTTAGGFTFSFIAPASGGGSFTTGTAATAGTFAGASKTMIARDINTPPNPVLDRGTIIAPTGGINATFEASVAQNAPNPPWWGIAPPGMGAGNQMPNNANTQTFYVIKGTSLSLYPSGAAPANPVLTLQVNADSTFEYFNGSWTRVD